MIIRVRPDPPVDLSGTAPMPAGEGHLQVGAGVGAQGPTGRQVARYRRLDKPAREKSEVDRVISAAATCALRGQILVGAAILAGRQVGIRIEPTTCCCSTSTPGILLRTRPNPLTAEKVLRLRGARPAGPPPRPTQEPVRGQRLADHTGVVSVCGQRVGVGRAYARRTLTVLVPTPPWRSSLMTATATSFAAPPPAGRYDQSQIAADDHHKFLDHLSQINWRENDSHQVSLDNRAGHRWRAVPCSRVGVVVARGA